MQNWKKCLVAFKMRYFYTITTVFQIFKCLINFIFQATKLIIPEVEDQIEGLILEISAGVGGQEAMLFCSELFEMYSNYCDSQGWDNNITHFERSDLEGARHATLSIEHPGNIIILHHLIKIFTFFFLQLRMKNLGLKAESIEYSAFRKRKDLVEFTHQPQPQSFSQNPLKSPSQSTQKQYQY